MTDQNPRLELEVFPLERSIGYIHHRVDLALSAGLIRAFAAAGRPDLTPEQWGVLSRLWQEEGVYQMELSARVGKDRHNMTRILSLLEKNGFIERQADPHDGRRQLVYLTSAGRNLQPELTRAAKDYLQTALQGLTQDEYDGFERIQRKIMNNLARINGNPGQGETGW